MAKKTTAEIAHIVVNVICFVIVVLLAALIEGIHIEPFRRGFFCGDETIKYPYKEDTVSVAVAVAVGFLLALFSILICEWIKFGGKKEDETTLAFIGRFVWTCGIELGIFMFGGALCQLGVSIIKLTVGRLRPHFLEVCNPDFSQINCSQGYVYEYECRLSSTATVSILREARLSFPSGHSSFLAFSMVYVILYLNNKARRQHCGLVKYVLQFAAFATAGYVCVSRIGDYKHHYTDVLAGFCIGVLFAFLTRLMIATHWTYPTFYKTTEAEVLPLRYKSNTTVNSVAI